MQSHTFHPWALGLSDISRWDERTLPTYITITSCSILFHRFIWSGVRSASSTCGDHQHAPVLDAYALSRLMTCTLLFGLSILTANTGNQVEHATGTFGQLGNCSVIIASGYVTIIHLISLWTPSALSKLQISRHITIIMVSISGVYVYRDIWPLATYIHQPKDIREGDLLWLRITCSLLGGAFIPLLTPRIPQTLSRGLENGLPQETTASWISLLTYSFLDSSILRSGSIRLRGPEDFPEIPSSDRTSRTVERAFPYLSRWHGGSNRHVMWSILALFKMEFCILAGLLTIKAISNFAAPVAINRLLEHLERGEGGTGGSALRPWVWVTLLFCGPLIGTIAFQAYGFYSVGPRAESMLIQLVFDHALRIRLKGDVIREEEHSHFFGKVHNLITTDVMSIIGGRDFLLLMLYTPLELGLAMRFLYHFLGWSAFVGLGVMIISLPIPSYLAKRAQLAQREYSRKTDARVHATSETLTIMESVKLLGWRRRMTERIAALREAELALLLRQKIIELIWTNVNSVLSIVQILTCYATFSIIAQKPLDASTVFSTIPVFNLIRQSLTNQLDLVSTMIRAKVSLDRLDGFLKQSKLLDEFLDQRTLLVDDKPPANLSLCDATFTWSASSAIDDYRLRIEGTVTFALGKITLIVGPTGSGKTSLLMALLGEMHQLQPARSNLSGESSSKRQTFAYAAQESWVYNATIRSNILFGSPYDEVRYRKVVYQCGLTRDLESFESGDLTEVGERGVTLSGGQKARITLARAVYSDIPILLLDDVLAALDTQTARHVTNFCLQGDLVRGRAVVLVTHNIALTKPIADLVIHMRDGKIVRQEFAEDVIDSAIASSEEEAEIPFVVSNAQTYNHTHEAIAAGDHPTGVLIKNEATSQGQVSQATMLGYLSTMGGERGTSFWLTVVIGSAMYEGLASAQTCIVIIRFLGDWAQRHQETEADEAQAVWFLSKYCGLVLASVVIYFSRSIMFARGQMRASRKIHLQLIDAVLGTTLRWLDTTPTSRILARCTLDIRAVDVQIPAQLLTLIEHSTMLVARLLAVVMFTPILAVPGIVILLVGHRIARLYLKAQLGVKRHSSVARALVLAHFGSTMAGLTSIRAYGAQDRARAELMLRSDRCMRINRLLYNLTRWINLRMDVLASLFPTVVAAYLVYRPHHGAYSIAGFSINQAVTFSSMILWWVRNMSNLEVSGNSLERLEDYSTIERESSQGTADCVIPQNWPATGELVVKNLSTRYSPNGPNVLDDISFHIRGGERIGIVGRTGSGKTSLIMSLLQCIYTEGEALYDGLSTSTMDVDTLREAMSIIPQVPELFSGTVRDNLDPFAQHEDSTLNAALESVGLARPIDKVGSEIGAKDAMAYGLQLGSPVSSGGSNLSVGQRQLIALARAIIRRSKLLILDEATSAIDDETDGLLQSSLRKHLPEDASMLIIAHRLQTVLDADRIMVIDAGRIVESGSPNDLLNRPGGHFRSLMAASEQRHFDMVGC